MSGEVLHTIGTGDFKPRQEIVGKILFAKDLLVQLGRGHFRDDLIDIGIGFGQAREEPHPIDRVVRSKVDD